MPPSVAVHSGDWKLIRLFHEGENGAHAYRLYNLADDLGERENLATAHPDKVEMLDRLIEKHLEDAEAVVPLRNPDFDPEQYKPERIGVGRRRVPANRKPVGKLKPNTKSRAEALFERRDKNTGTLRMPCLR